MSTTNDLLAGLRGISNRRRGADAKKEDKGNTVAVGLPPVLNERLGTVANARGLTKAGLMREALTEYLANHAAEIDVELADYEAQLAAAASTEVPAASAPAPSEAPKKSK